MANLPDKATARQEDAGPIVVRLHKGNYSGDDRHSNHAPAEWIQASSRNPCPICEATHWCQVTSDGSIAMCRYDPDGAWKSDNDRNGVAYYMHRLRDSLDFVPRATPVRIRKPKAPPADLATRTVVYQALLALPELALTKKHRAALQARGLDDATIERLGYRSFPNAKAEEIAGKLTRDFKTEVLLGIPGFFINSSGNLSLGAAAGLLVPSLTPKREIQAIKVRPDSPLNPKNKYFYLSSKTRGGVGSGAPVHAPEHDGIGSAVVRLTEGEIKADVSTHLSGLLTISMPGVGSWPACIPVARELGANTILLAFDRDAYTNKHVARAFVACHKRFVDEGFVVKIERWDPADGKGIDDVLSSGKPVQVLEGTEADAALEEARATLEEETDPDPGDDDAEATIAQSEQADAEILVNQVLTCVMTAGAPELYGDEGLMCRIAALESVAPGKYAALVGRLKAIREIEFSVRLFESALRPHRLAARQSQGGGEIQREQYTIKEGGFCREVMTEAGPTSVWLCNFTASITEELTNDDGIQQTKKFAVEGRLASGRPFRAEVPAADFDRMDWIKPSIGADAQLAAGKGTRDYIRAAIESHSDVIEKQTVRCHIGWVKIDGQWHYLHTGGAISAEGNDPLVRVNVNAKLSPYRLPDPPVGDKLISAIRAALRPAKFASKARPYSDIVAALTLCLPWRAALGETLANIWAEGLTGAHKTEWAANVLMRFFGVDFHRENAPGNFSATDNSLEAEAYEAKDALFLIDDYRPPENPPNARAKYEACASRVLRNAANRQGRDRLRPDGTLQTSKYPRGTILGTAETNPPDTSVIARTFIVQFVPDNESRGILGTLDKGLLRQCSADGKSGLYAQAMAGFLKYIAPKYGEVRDSLRSRADKKGDELRREIVAQGLHPRTPEIVADLMLGFEEFLLYALDSGAITQAEANTLQANVEAGLTKGAFEQPAHQSATDPVLRFFELLRASLTQGTAYLGATDGAAPADMEAACGWRYEEYDPSRAQWKVNPNARKIGWIKGDNLWLQPDPSFAAAQELAGRQGSRLPFDQQTMSRRLRAKNLLLQSEKTNNTVKKYAEKAYHRVWVLPLHLLIDLAGDLPESLAEDNSEALPDFGRFD